MRLLRLLLASLLAASCSSESNQGAAEAAPEVGPVTVAITTPIATTYTNGTVTLSLTVTGAPDSVELLADGAPLATLVAPYTFDWDTRTRPEGKVQVIARATRAGVPVESMPRLVVIDRTAPTVVTRLPAPGATTVGVEDPITLEVSEPLLVDSVNDVTVALQKGAAPVAKTVSLSADGTKITIKPAATPVAPATLSATIAAGVTDLAGNPLTLPADPWKWTLPHWVALGDVVAPFKAGTAGLIGLATAINKSDAPCALVTEDNKAAVRCWDGKEWPMATAALDASRYAGDGGGFAIDPSGAPLAATQKGVGPTGRVVVDRWDGTAWKPLGGAVVEVEALTSHAMALDAAGRPVVGLATGYPYTLAVARWNGSAWIAVGAPKPFSPTAFFPTDVAIALDASDRPVLSWTEYPQQNGPRGGEKHLYVQRWNGSAWVAVGSSPAGAGTEELGSALRLDASGNPIIAWISLGKLRVSRWSGSSWVAMGAPFERTSDSRAHLTLDRNGAPVILRNEYVVDASDNYQTTLLVDRWTGTAWERVGDSVVAFPDPLSVGATPHAIAFDAKNRAVVSWRGGMKQASYAWRENR